MNKETFFIMLPEERVDIINKMLQTMTLKEIGEKLDIPHSTFLKEMTAGDYVFIQRENRYYKFVREDDSISRTTRLDDYSEELSFLRENLNLFKDMTASESNLVLNKKIYSKDAVFSNRSIKMNEDVYADFSNHCHEKFPQFRLQDLVAQSLLDFIEKY